MSDKTHKIAVLTGDLVNSTGLGPEKVERAFVALEDCAEMQAEWMGGQSLHFTRHRGDGWQVALAEPKYALRSALCFRAALRALGEEFDSYIGIAEGDVEGEIGPDLNEETSVVFSKSGEALEISKGKIFDIKMHFTDKPLMNATYIAADIFCTQWTPTQAKTIFYTFDPYIDRPSTHIAQKLGKSRQAVSKSLGASHSDKIELIMQNVEDSYDA